jgi:hypothetical protein
MAENRGVIGATIFAATLALAACNTTQTVSPTAAEGARIAFESIDGPPRPVSSRLARTLDEEAAARRLVTVARGGQANYHIRGYLAVNAEGSAASIAWAFDVYDEERRRAFRLRGEEPAPGTGSWGTVNDALLRRIASSSVAQLMAMIASDRAPAGATAAAPGPATISGLLGGSAAPAGSLAAAPTTDR